MAKIERLNLFEDQDYADRLARRSDRTSPALRKKPVKVKGEKKVIKSSKESAIIRGQKRLSPDKKSSDLISV